MGKKKDELRLEIQRRESDNTILARENDSLRERLAELEASPYRLRLVTDGQDPSTRVKIAKALGIELDDPRALTDDAILEAVERLRMPGARDPEDDHPAMVKDSLAQAIMHNKHERQDLHTGLVQTRGIVQRVAAALGVSEWNPDGDQIVEKAQRFGAFRYWLRSRLNGIESSLSDFDKARVDELRTTLAVLVGEKELAKLLQNKPMIKASKTLLDLAENPAPTGNTYLDVPFDAADVGYIKLAFERTLSDMPHQALALKRIEQLHLVLVRMQESPAASEELSAFMNAVVLPYLRKHHPAYQPGAPFGPKEN